MKTIRQDVVGKFAFRTDQDGIVHVRTRLCGSKFVETDGPKKGEEYYCDREEGHLPSDWHRNREHKAVWFKDRN